MKLSWTLLKNNESLSKLLSLKSPTKNVAVKGWVSSVQKFGQMYFLKVNDRISCAEVQAVLPRQLAAKFTHLNVGSAVSLLGSWVPSQGKQQSMELNVEQCDFIGYNEEPLLPSDNDLLRQKLHLRAKDSAFAAILRLKSHLNSLTHQFFTDKSFFYVDTPSLTRNDCEDGGEVFKVEALHDNDFFGKEKFFLTGSAQLHLEAILSGLPRVYTVAPAFRADKSMTRQHLSEFRMLEAEYGFVNTLEDICAFVEEYLKFVSMHLLRFEEDLQMSSSLCNRTLHLLDYFATNKVIPRITYKEATQILKADGVSFIDKLSKSNELYLVEKFKGPVFLTNYPVKLKPFYMKRTTDGLFVENFDLLAPFVGELAGGSIREDDFDKLSKIFAEDAASKVRPISDDIMTINFLVDFEDPLKNNLDWYAALRRAGHPCSGGFGLGIERLTQTLLGIENIKDTLSFPRWYKNCKF